MARITIELDDETVRALARLGPLEEVLRRLANGSARVWTEASPAEAALSGGRGATDHQLLDERAQVDHLLRQQREVNTQLVVTSLRSQDQAEEAQLAQQRAEENARLLQELSELRELFIGVLGHDLRNPLNGILIAAGLLLRRGRLDPADVPGTERILAGAQKISRMVTELLDLTRIRLAGGFPIHRKPVDLRTVLSESLAEFSAPLELRAEGPLPGWWDPDRVSQLVSNLVGNALDYAVPGSTVTVSARAEGGGARVEVANLGPALSAEILPMLFEPFRGKRGAAAAGSGHLGLGLFIAREIARGHGGDISARSADGITVFSVLLPGANPAALGEGLPA